MTPSHNHKPRTDVIEQLAQDALAAIEDSGIVDLSAAEVLSTCFTITKRVCKVLLSVENHKDKEYNINQIMGAIADLYSIVPERTIH